MSTLYRAVGNRCAVDVTSLRLPITNHEILDILYKKGFESVDVNIIDEARAHIGKAAFRLGVRMSETPATFDCSSFTKWLYGMKGIWIPRLATQQFEHCTPVDLEAIQTGDLIFTSGYCKKAWHIGHVSLYTGHSVITAMIQKSGRGIIEISLEKLITQRKLQGVGRITNSLDEISTLIIPPSYEVETSDDIKYLVLSSIS